MCAEFAHTKGTIVTVTHPGDYGFIAVRDRKDVFFHVTQLVGLVLEPRLIGREVEFEIEELDGRVRARRVRAADRQESDGDGN